MESERLQFSRGELELITRTFLGSREGEKKGRPQNRIYKYAKMDEFSEQIPSPDITQIWLGWHGLGWHSLLGTWARFCSLPQPHIALEPPDQALSPTLRWPLIASATAFGSECVLRMGWGVVFRPPSIC